MEEYHRHCDEVRFNAEEAHNIVKECIDGVLGGEDYDQDNINQWTASIVEQSLAHLVKLGKAYKYIGKAHTLAQNLPALQSPVVMAMGNKQTGSSGDKIM